MRKLIFVFLTIIVLAMAACGQQKQVSEKTQEKIPENTAQAAEYSDPALSSMDNDMKTTDSTEEDLGSDDFSDTDNGLSEVENI